MKILKIFKNIRFLWAFAGLGIFWPSYACTGISLISEDGGIVAARTVEWSHSNASHDTFVIYPRNHAYAALTPDGANGLQWNGKYGFVALSSYGQPFGPDGMNEHGLYVGMYYFPDFASFEPYQKECAAQSMSVGDLMNWILSSFSTVEEVRSNLDKVRVVYVNDESFGGAPLPFHWKVADPSGASIIIEITDQGRVRVFDALLGVITNSPSYDWHLTNLRNYLGLRPGPEMSVRIEDRNFTPLGAGSGLRGLPGDYTPPSRFVRAVALTASVKPLESSEEAVFEAFRILDNFNIPIGSSMESEKIPEGVLSATQITTANDLTGRKIYFHTMADRQVRMLDLSKINFSDVKHQFIDSGVSNTQTIKEIMVSREVGGAD